MKTMKCIFVHCVSVSVKSTDNDLYHTLSHIAVALIIPRRGILDSVETKSCNISMFAVNDARGKNSIATNSEKKKINSKKKDTKYGHTMLAYTYTHSGSTKTTSECGEK